MNQNVSSGFFQTSVLFRLKGGKNLIFKLQGQILSQDDIYISTGIQNNFILKSINVGMNQNPIQSFELTNHSLKEIEYLIDLNAINDLNKSNFDFPIFECLNPSGKIQSKQKIEIQFKLNPLEHKLYNSLFKIYSKDALNGINGNSIQINIQGQGFTENLNVLNENDQFIQNSISIPKSQKIKIPNQLAIFSNDFISFGNLNLINSLFNNCYFLDNFR
jgi:hypothetical protein